VHGTEKAVEVDEDMPADLIVLGKVEWLSIFQRRSAYLDLSSTAVVSPEEGPNFLLALGSQEFGNIISYTPREV
jgi:hypothetical protein